MNEQTSNIQTPPVSRRIMWVEDDVFLSDIIKKKCSANKCDLMQATTAEETFSQLKTQLPDIIILDILLPGRNGFEILKELKETTETKNIPVIILSNFGQKEEVQKGIELGAEKYLVKATLSLDDILVEVNRVLQDTESEATSSSVTSHSSETQNIYPK
jgi:DNA-binding response OmpR family regulator